MIEILCRCGRQLQVPEAGVGRSGRCPFCQQKLRLVAPGFEADGRGFEAELLCIAGPALGGTQLILGGPGPIEIGKLPGKPVQLADASVSRAHCRLVRAPHGWRIEDQNSHNGTHVNERRVDRCDLRDSDLIRIGPFEFKYIQLRDAEAPAALVPGGRLAEAEPDSPAGFDDDGLYALAAEEDIRPAIEIERPATARPSSGGTATAIAPLPSGGSVCPSCRRTLPASAKICVQCGINIQTGRSILTRQEESLDQIYATVESIIRWLSWLIWFGIYPIASEAFGTSRPWVIRGIAAVTVLVSLWFLAHELADSPQMQTHKNLMLWCGEAPPEPEQLEFMYALTSYGDSEAFEAEFEELAESPAGEDLSEDELILAAHEALPPEQQCLGQYRPSQLITHAFLHAGILHLAGNMIFLLVFGSRVNALIGNLLTLAVYPILAVGSGYIQMASMTHLPPIPSLGASGAIMGLAGMYLVLFPVHKVHMVFWYRLGLIFGFRLSYKVFAVRGLWVVLFYIAFDVVYILLEADDNVGHWAHFGGFLVGAGVALLGLATRVVNARGGDLLSIILGRRAWALVGRPRT